MSSYYEHWLDEQDRAAAVENAEWERTPEGRAWKLQAENDRLREAASAAETALHEQRQAQQHPDEWREWLKVRPLLPVVIDFGPDRPMTFDGFLSEVGPRPSEGHVVVRVDETGAFDRGNMVWARRPGETGTLAPPRLDGKCYSTSEFAALVGKSAYTVRQMCLRGIVRAERDDRAGRTGEWRIPPSELVRWRQEGPFRLPRTRS
jgi:hypothetical protein